MKLFCGSRLPCMGIWCIYISPTTENTMNREQQLQQLELTPIEGCFPWVWGEQGGWSTSTKERRFEDQTHYVVDVDKDGQFYAESYIWRRDSDPVTRVYVKTPSIDKLAALVRDVVAPA